METVATQASRGTAPPAGTGTASAPRELDEDKFLRGRLYGQKRSSLRRYQDLVIGSDSLWELLRYELITLFFGSIPGALGLLLRKVFYRRLFARVGRGVHFGRNLTIRCGRHIEIGDHVFVDDGACLDGRGAAEGKVRIGNHVVVNRGATVQSKDGPIEIGDHCLIGSLSVIASQGGISIGEWVSIAGSCEVSGGIFAPRDEEDAVSPASDTGGSEGSRPPFRRYTKGPVRIDRECVLGFGVAVLDGVHVGEGCMIGAGSVLLQNVPPNSTVSQRPGVVLKRK